MIGNRVYAVSQFVSFLKGYQHVLIIVLLPADCRSYFVITSGYLVSYLNIKLINQLATR